MGSVLLTDLLVRSLGVPGVRREVADSQVRGLFVRVDRSGAVSWSLRYRRGGRDSVRVRVALGSYPETSLARAREKAAAILADPAKDAIEQPATLAELVAAWAADVDGSAAPAWRRAWRAEQLRVLGLDALPVFGDRAASSIRRGEFVALFSAVADRAPATANRLRKALMQVFSWAVHREVMASNPLDGTKPPAAERSRDRVLTDEEIRAIARGIETAQATARAGIPILFALATLQRIGECLTARVEDIAGDWWTIPADKTKAKRAPHRVPLSRLARSVLAEATPKDGWLFPGLDGLPMRPTVVAKFAASVSRRMRIARWRAHDLRRTGATLLVERGEVEEWIVGRLLGHSSRDSRVSRATPIYVRTRYDAQKRDAMERWDEILTAILDPLRDVTLPPSGAAG